jgi:hypothetical protein
MPTQLTAEHAKQSLTAHVAAKGGEIFAKYGPQIGWPELQRLLEDRACVRYPCVIRFDAAGLQPGEFAYPAPNGERPEDGFILYVHPIYQSQLAMVPFLAFYQLVVVNYGEFASADDAEVFASSALGLDRELYYHALCRLADRLDPAALGPRDRPGAAPTPAASRPAAGRVPRQPESVI